MHARRQPLIGQEAQRIAHVDDGVSRARRYPLPFFRLGAHKLKSPLFAEQEGKRANVCVLIVANAGRGQVLGVTEEDESRV